MEALDTNSTKLRSGPRPRQSIARLVAPSHRVSILCSKPPDLIVSGAGTAGGALHIEGFWLVPGPIGNFQGSGTLGGKRVAVLVPEA
jgi:hypothetical protein